MRRGRRPIFRDKLDLTDRTQVRVVTRRLRLSESELAEIVGKSGNSIAAIAKEVAIQRAAPTQNGASTPPAAVINTVTKPEQDISAEASL